MTYKELNDESVKLLYEFTPLFDRLKTAVSTNRDPFSIISSISHKLRSIDENLLSVLAVRDRAFLLDYLKVMLKEEGISAHFVLPRYGVPVKLISSFIEILVSIFRKKPEKTYMVNIESYDNGCAIYSVLQNVKFEEIQNISVVKAISTLDGVLLKYDENGSKIILPNIFGREKFLKIYSKNGIVALPWICISGHETMDIQKMKKEKQNLELCLGADRIHINADIAGEEIALRAYPKNPVRINYFKGVIIDSDGFPVPVINISEIIAEGVFEWLC
jgi:hypothetical protein